MTQLWTLSVLLALVAAGYSAVEPTCKWRTYPPGSVLAYCESNKYLGFVADCQNYVNITLNTCKDDIVVDGSRKLLYKYNIKNINVQKPRQDGLFVSKMDKYPDVILERLTLQDGDLTSIPQELYSMKKLKGITIYGNKIIKVNLNNFLLMTMLNDINLAKNMISFIETDERNNTNTIQSIDLSYNDIEVLPDDFLNPFNTLQHLYLSHNQINSIRLRTFEEVTQLLTLDLSHNRLFKLGSAFAKLHKLQELTLTNNDISRLIDYNFLTLLNLEKMNVSHNNINEIENDSFQNLSKLKVLDLGHNKIETIYNGFFNSCISLQSLTLTGNQLQSIEANSFKQNKITEFIIHNNSLTGPIEKGTFKGVNVHELNLSGERITSIQDEALIDMIDLKYLNLSLNAIENISPLAFSSQLSLETLDLSHNQLKELNFKSSSLKNLIKLYARHNNIKKITKTVLENLTALKELDLSYNDIKEIEPESFSKLNNLVSLTLTGTNFVNVLESKALSGLSSLQNIELPESRTTCFKNESFSGLISLSHINFAYGQLKEIEFNAFLGSGSLQFLNLSNNQLDSFHVNPSTIYKVKEIYLDNNYIRNITSETFSHLSLLQTLNLANNDILQVHSDAFKYLHSLLYLDLSSNTKMNFDNKPFQYSIKLKKLLLRNVNPKLTFESGHASTEVLEVQSCGIADLNKVYINSVNNVKYLNLSRNEITVIDKDSFKNMTSLIDLDLSLNKITHIKPGSFFYLKNLSILSLYGNDLPQIQFGALVGPKSFSYIDLSDNLLHRFDIKSLPAVENLSLDDNQLTVLNFNGILNSNIAKLSIGGNQFSCELLVEIKFSNLSANFDRIITAKSLNYYSENVNGISCQTIPFENTGLNPVITLLRNTLEKIDETEKTLEKFIESNNKYQMTSNEYLKKIAGFSDDTRIDLMDPKDDVLPSYKTESYTSSPLSVLPSSTIEPYTVVYGGGLTTSFPLMDETTTIDLK